VAAPGPAAWPDLDLADREYQPVTLTGHFRNDSEVHVVYVLSEPKGPVGGVGYMVMTPFVADDGWIAWVNRGFVPTDREAPETRREGLIDGETAVTGLLRRPQVRAWFSPADNAAANRWFSRDPGLYSAAAGLPPGEVAPYIVDAVHDPGLPGGLPQGGETVVTFPNSHLGYAVTWFGLAAALAGVFAVFALRRLRIIGS
jgi:surfeit locus 1 family protein